MTRSSLRAWTQFRRMAQKLSRPRAELRSVAGDRPDQVQRLGGQPRNRSEQSKRGVFLDYLKTRTSPSRQNLRLQRQGRQQEMMRLKQVMRLQQRTLGRWVVEEQNLILLESKTERSIFVEDPQESIGRKMSSSTPTERGRRGITIDPLTDAGWRGDNIF